MLKDVFQLFIQGPTIPTRSIKIQFGKFGIPNNAAISYQYSIRRMVLPLSQRCEFRSNHLRSFPVGVASSTNSSSELESKYAERGKREDDND